MSSRKGRLPAAAAGLALLLPLGCGGSKAEDEPRPPIVLISIDTLRSDRLPAYGYRGVETPAIDALRRDGILFERAYSHAASTLPAHASMLSGLLPPEHGVRDNMGYRLGGEDVPMLAALLTQRGYATGGAVSSFVLRRETGIAAGFEFFDDRIGYRAGLGAEGLQRLGGETLAAALPWLRSVADRPFFLFLHLYEPHSPYKPPEPFASRYESPYDGEVAAADRVVGDILQELKQIGIYEDSVILLTSDHGEGLGDHGEDEHGIFVYREILQIPLILKLPGAERGGTACAAPVQLVDILPTLARLAGLEAPEASPGTSLLRVIDHPPAERLIYGETYYPRLYFGWSELATLIGRRFQYIESPEPELYDLERDPLQRTNIFHQERRTGAAYDARLQEIERRFEPPSPVDAETRNRLVSLGYVGGASSSSSDVLPAPASQIHLLAAFKEAARAAARQRHEEAVSALRGVLAENPAMVVAWEQLAHSLESLRRPDEALEAYQEALRRSDGAPHLALSTARLLAAFGRYDEARRQAVSALDWDPASAHQLLARVALAEGDLTRAEREARAALDASGEQPATLLTLARVKFRQNRLSEALELTERVERASAGQPLRTLYLLRGNVLAESGRTTDAAAAFRREIELFPQGSRAYSRLALLYAGAGEGQKAVQVLQQLVSRNPTAAGHAAAVRTLRALGQRQAAEELLQLARRKFPGSRELDRLGR